MDDETAEIELLEQNLNKTRQIAQRMTAILASFDTRLAKLEKSIRPLYDSTQILNRRANNIDKALIKIDEIASNQEGVAVEEALILRGPQPGQFDIYQDALGRLNATIAFKDSDRDSRDTARLVETGAKKITQLYTKLAAEASSGPSPLPGADAQTDFPRNLFSSLQELVSFLRTLPLPATHPSHPASQAILSTLREAQRGYADMRGAWGRKCLEGQGKRVIDRVDSVDGVLAGKEFGKWAANLLSVAEAEYNFLLDLAPLPNPSDIASTFNTLLVPLMTLFSNTLSSLISIIKRSIHRYTFLALATYDSLSTLSFRWDELVLRRSEAAVSVRRDINELKEGLHALRAVCLRSFPEFLADIKVNVSAKGGEGTGIVDFTRLTLNYLERLPEVRDAVGAALLILGDGNWKMGEGAQVGKASKLGEGDEAMITEHYTYDVISTVISSLSALAKAHKRPTFGSVLFLNNVMYLFRRIVTSPKASALSSLLAKPAVDLLSSNSRIAKAGYFDANFSPLLQALTDDPRERAVMGRSSTKDKLTRFFDLLEEVVERHKIARVLEDDVESRNQIADEVVKLVVPSLQRFTQKQRDKNPQKYMKLPIDAVESQIRALYS